MWETLLYIVAICVVAVIAAAAFLAVVIFSGAGVMAIGAMFGFKRSSQIQTEVREDKELDRKVSVRRRRKFWAWVFRDQQTTPENSHPPQDRIASQKKRRRDNHSST